MDEKLYTITDLSNELAVSRQTIYNWLGDDFANGRFPNAFKVGQGDGAIILVPASDVEKVRNEEAAKLIKKLDRLGFQTVPA